MTVTIRPARNADRSAMFTVHVRSIRETCSRSYSPKQIDAWIGILSPDDYTSVLQQRVMVVATDGDDLVGFAQLAPAAREVQAIYVLPERQGEGIGQLLLSELERQALARGISRLELSATLNSIGFYERAGYGQRCRAVHRMLTGVELPCVRMGKKLQAR